MELIDQLTKSLGVTEDQAKGGAGMLFKHAKGKLGGDDFAKVAAVVPGVDGLISAAPAAGEAPGGLGKLMSALPGGLGSLSGLAGGFSKLGMNGGMIGKFIPVILSFVQGKGGDGVKGILEKALKK